VRGRILIITHSFPPILDAESILLAKTVKYLGFLGWEVDVLCSQPPKSIRLRKLLNVEIDSTLFKLLPKNIKIYRHGDSLTQVFMKALGKFYPAAKLLPDEWIGWLPRAIILASHILSQNDFDAILTWSMPISVSLVGLALRKKFTIPWVAHFSDPWTDNPYHDYRLFPKYFNLKWEKKVIEDADAIIFVAEETRNLVGKKYNSWFFKKAYVIPHYFDKDLMNFKQDVKDCKLNIVHAGKFYPNRRPDKFLKAIQELRIALPDLPQKLKVQFIGKIDSEICQLAKELGLQDMVNFIPPVPYLESLKYIKLADILLVIDAPSDYPSPFLPSKLIDYLGSGNPILALTPERGETASLIRQIDGWIADPSSVISIKNILLKIIKEWEENRLREHCYPFDNIKQYDAWETTNKLINIFTQICYKRNSLNANE
jgi:glycosyltransferase involved in cell wall biosynthesis